ncbi:MAG: hypothetical protein GVY18_09970 [Bacteroidetes bacterium]|jgi:anti-sigma factor RsiW|nr:hypothetical protein [Bacteroidota bacterium]
MPTPTSDWIDDRIDAYLDGDLPEDERAAVEQHLAVHPDAKAEVTLARRVRDGLRALPEPTCPDRVTRTVLAEVHRRQRADRFQRLRAWIERQWLQFWQPALAMSVLLLLIATALLVGQPPQPSPNAVADAEVQHALDEVRWTLAYLSDVSQQAGASVRDEVLERRVVAPMHRAVHPLVPDAPLPQ